MQKILFICTHNAARSQMAEALLHHKFADNYAAHSAGTDPTYINPYTERVLAELGVNIAFQNSKHVNEFLGQEIDLVVTLCDLAEKNCPFFPGAKQYLHKSFEDPSQLTGSEEQILEGFRKVRDEIAKWIDEEFGPPRNI